MNDRRQRRQSKALAVLRGGYGLLSQSDPHSAAWFSGARTGHVRLNLTCRDVCDLVIRGLVRQDHAGGQHYLA
jgi:hypothetical protein